ncbi:hypothetical protein ACE6H2_012884 [Prunus campanulata]
MIESQINVKWGGRRLDLSRTSVISRISPGATDADVLLPNTIATTALSKCITWASE